MSRSDTGPYATTTKFKVPIRLHDMRNGTAGWHNLASSCCKSTRRLRICPKRNCKPIAAQTSRAYEASPTAKASSVSGQSPGLLRATHSAGSRRPRKVLASHFYYPQVSSILENYSRGGGLRRSCVNQSQDCSTRPAACVCNIPILLPPVYLIVQLSRQPRDSPTWLRAPVWIFGSAVPATPPSFEGASSRLPGHGTVIPCLLQRRLMRDALPPSRGPSSLSWASFHYQIFPAPRIRRLEADAVNASRGWQKKTETKEEDKGVCG